MPPPTTPGQPAAAPTPPTPEQQEQIERAREQQEFLGEIAAFRMVYKQFMRLGYETEANTITAVMADFLKDSVK